MRNLAPVILLAMFAALSISSMLQNSGTCDEIAHHIPAGYSYYKQWDFRLNPSNPPLSRYIMALPLAFLDLKAPFDETCWRDADTPVFSHKLIYEYNTGEAKTIIFLSRLPIVFIGILAGFLAYLMASRYYGEKGGVFSLFLFSMSPELIAHAGLATTDMAAASFMLLAIYTFWRFMKNPGPYRIIFAGIALGLAQLSKYTAVLLYPVFFILLLAEFIASRKIDCKLFAKVISIFILSVIVIWAGYGFKMQPFLEGTTGQQEKIRFAKNVIRHVLPSADDKKIEGFLHNKPMPLTTYITGLLGVIKHSNVGHNTFFIGRWSDYGSPLYYAVALMIKTPIPILLFFLASIISFCFKRIKKDELYILIPLLAVFFTASINRLQIGIRYILPIYPLCFVLSSRIIDLIMQKWQRLILIILCIWLVLANSLAWPHYLSYFNEFIGGPNNGWKYLRDSNIDWGQDLPALSRYMADNHIEKVTLEYFGKDRPESYGINYRLFEEDEFVIPRNRVYVISVNYLDRVKWAKDIKPTTKAGYSIFIYDFRKR